MLVIVTHELDPHADAVIWALRRDGFEKILRIDLETVSSRFEFRIEPLASALSFSSRDVPSRVCGSQELTTIWWRRAGRLKGADRNTLAPTPENLDATESYHAIKWFLESVSESAYPLGHPNQMRAAENKFLQLRIASEIGFQLPPTLFTNDAARLSTFAAANGDDLVVKPLKTSYVYDEASGQSISLYAALCNERQLADLSAEATQFSLYCQRRVHKKTDIRVNVFPKDAVACSIDVSGLGDSVDWRPTTLQHDHKIIPLPSKIEEKCRTFLKRMNLRWGAFDFALTDQNDWVFFECNPNGQWLWIETMTRFPISGIVAGELRQHHGRK